MATANERTSSANRVTWVGFYVNLVLTSAKLAAGIIGHSGAMVADAVHSLSDFATDIVVLASFRFVGKPIDKCHDYGHGKYETLATAVIGMALLLVGGGIFWGGATKIWAGFRGESLEAPGWIALVAAVVSIIVKEWLYRYTVKVGRHIDSQAVVANAWHHRSDAFSSIGTMLGIGGAILLGAKWHILDPLAAIIVSFFIIKVAVEISSGSIRELVEESLSEEVETEILEIASATPGVANPHNLRTRRIGSEIAVDLHVRVDADLHVSQAHVIASQIETRIRERFGQSTFVSVHIEPLMKEAAVS
jgi:cation diffusion facilitator family transporter